MTEPETLRLTLIQMFNAFAEKFGTDDNFLVTRLPNGAIKLEVAPGTTLRTKASAPDVYPFTREDLEFLARLNIVAI